MVTIARHGSMPILVASDRNRSRAPWMHVMIARGGCKSLVVGWLRDVLIPQHASTGEPLDQQSALPKHVPATQPDDSASQHVHHVLVMQSSLTLDAVRQQMLKPQTYIYIYTYIYLMHEFGAMTHPGQAATHFTT